jgi:hypothetical protein
LLGSVNSSRRRIQMKFGLKPFAPDPRDLQFAKYRTPTPLPPHPVLFGHEDLITDWGILGNDQYGDCAFAGPDHEEMLWTAMGGAPVSFTLENVLSDYAAVTGFDPATGANDNGADMHDVATYRQKTGMIDSTGARHKIGAYVFIDPRNYDQFLEAIWLFGCVGMGIKVPQSALDQFHAGEGWSVVPRWHWGGRQIVGGHYICAVANRTSPMIVTWGKAIPMTSDFYQTYCDVCVAYVSPEMLTAGKSPEGFDLATLQNDLSELQAA